MPNPFAKIKGHVESKWLEEVYQNDRWLSLEDWAARFEPKKEKKPETEFQQKTKAKIAAKAKETILGKLRVGITAKLTLLVLEVASRVLQQVQGKMVGPAEEFVNTTSAIVLSYRFQRSKRLDRKKAEFFRKTAVDQLTQLIDDAGNKLATVQMEMRQQLAAVQDVKSFVSDKVDEILAVAETKTTEMESRAVSMADEAQAVLDAAGIERPPVLPDKAQALDKKDEIVAMLTAVIKDGILTKLDTVAVTMSGLMDQLFVAVTLANARGKKMKVSGKLREVIASTVEGIHSEMETAVEAEVSRVVVLIGSMTEKTETEENEFEEE